jgi:hypothetical protein
MLATEHRKEDEQSAAPAHLSKRPLANHFDRPEIVETKFCAAEPEKSRLLLAVLEELPLLPVIGHHRVRLQPPLELDAP